MSDMIGCCGLNCTQCGAYIATQTDDDAKREEVARDWTQKHGGHFTADQIDCDGCQADGRAPDWTAKLCPIRKCCRERKIDTCAACEQYPCEQLEGILKVAPEARDNLEALRR
jgi:hypothetical protein